VTIGASLEEAADDVRALVDHDSWVMAATLTPLRDGIGVEPHAIDDDNEEQLAKLTKRAWALGYRLIKRTDDYLLWVFISRGRDQSRIQPSL